MGIPKQIDIIDRKTLDGADVKFRIDDIHIPGVVDYAVKHAVAGLPRVTFTVAAQNVYANIQAVIEEDEAE